MASIDPTVQHVAPEIQADSIKPQDTRRRKSATVVRKVARARISNTDATIAKANIELVVSAVVASVMVTAVVAIIATKVRPAMAKKPSVLRSK